MTRTSKTQVPATITIAARTYEVDASGWCAKLEAWVVRNHRGQLVTIPA